MKQSALAELKFKPLKVNLQKIFKEIRFDVDDGITPDPCLINNFIKQVEIMVSYSGFGDENYPAFLEAARKLGDLSKDTPQAVWLEHLRIINDLRRHCHSSFRGL